jgi:hypothetical protein
MTSALKWGALSGAAAYVVYLGLTFLEQALQPGHRVDITTRPILLVPPCLLYFTLLFAFSAAGFYTGRESGRADLGAVAGMITLAVLYVLEHIYSPATGSAQAPGQAAPAAAFAIIAGVLVFGLAAAMGWLGGRPGAQRHVHAPVPSSVQSGDPLPPA